MRVMQRGVSAAGEPRYDAGTLRKVAALAARLQSRQQETLTAREIESIGTEAGLEPAFIHQALAEVTAEPLPVPAPAPLSKAELWSRVAAFTIPVWWSLLAAGAGPYGAMMIVLLLWPLAAYLGYLAGKKNLGVAAAIELLFLSTLVIGGQGNSGSFAMGFFMIGAPLAGGLGWLGANFRERRIPPRAVGPVVSRQGLLNLLFALQRQLEGQRQRRTFMSVDVVGSSEMKRGAPELAVEHSFGQFRVWVEERVRGEGGVIESAAGDGMMALFPTDAGAVRAARQLQEGLPRFNQEQNRLPQPFRIRCGVTAGEVAIEEGMPLGHLQSPVIDRAAALQKQAEPGDIVVSGEVAGAALLELGGLEPLPEPVAGEPAFSWRAGGRSALQ